MICCLVASAWASPPAVPTNYQLREGLEALEALKHTAVERSLEPFGVFTKPFARRRLEGLFKACPVLKVGLSGDDFVSQCEDEAPFRWQVGTEGRYEGETGVFTARLDRRGDDLVLDFENEDGEGGKSYTYTFSGGAMTLTHRVRSQKLTVPMAWTVHYDRVTP